MIFNRTDKQYEEAGRDDEKFERLLRRAQKDRRGVLILPAMVMLLLLPLVLWCGIPLIHGLALMHAGHFGPAIEAMQPITDFIGRHESALIGGGFEIFFAINVIVVLLRETYVRVNVLLLFRGLRDRQRANPQE